MASLSLSLHCLKPSFPTSSAVRRTSFSLHASAPCRHLHSKRQQLQHWHCTLLTLCPKAADQTGISKGVHLALTSTSTTTVVAILNLHPHNRSSSRRANSRESLPKHYFSPAAAQSISFPPRLGPLFWPWEKVKVGPLSVSPMGFGTWAWGNQLLWGYKEEMDSVLQETFNLAIQNGINIFDTADSYGTGRLSGQSERLLGRFIREYQGSSKICDNIVVATKFAAYPWRLTSGQFVRACKSSLERLKLEKIGIGQLHWSTANYAPPQELALWDGLVAMYDQGLVRGVGVSNYGPKQLIKINDYLKSRGVPLCSAQVQFSLLSMGEEQKELKAVCDSLGIKIISYSPLGLGMLTGKYMASKLPRGPRGLLFRQILPGLDPLLSSLKDIAGRRGRTMSQVAINWCIRKGTIPIPGVKTVEQAKDNLGALGWHLTSDEIFVLESAAQKSSAKMIQNIFQTR